jgi:hypothetical protein
MGQQDEARKARISFALVVAAVPAAWAAEVAARRTVLAGHADAIAAVFGAGLRRVAWVALGLAVVFGLLSVALRPALRLRYNAGGAMMAGASIAQLPGIAACTVGMLGADPVPVALTAAVCTVFVAFHRPRLGVDSPG